MLYSGTFFFQFAKHWTESNGLESKSLTPVLCRASANKLKNKENVYTPKSAVKDDDCFVFPEPKTPVNKNQYNREILSTPNHCTTPSKGICMWTNQWYNTLNSILLTI